MSVQHADESYALGLALPEDESEITWGEAGAYGRDG